ncbi:MAG TPA: agmatinase [Pyrinomonadaceae bacterium]|nr:agmatinase [Pyrinomonadaceae bacterium]
MPYARDMNRTNNARIAIIGLPFDINSSYLRGAAEAPPKIREALFSDAYHWWSEGGLNLESYVHVAGDVEARDEDDLNAVIESSIQQLLDKEQVPISLGGDHAVTVPIVRAFAKKYPKLSILHFDAHSDIYDEFQGNRYSHACPFARIMEEGLAQRLVQVGIRTLNGHQREQVKRFGVEVFEMKNWRDDETFDFEGPVYISFDIDGLDPAFAPGVSHREPGGLSTRQAINVIHKLKGQVVGADIVEFNPRMDPSNVTAVVCAKLLKEIAAQMLAADERG